ncbi:asparaginase domain-containing protein [Marinicella sp. S1101]|uniref:asparaginase domain-containing protein n=1 Tax=Marinicella marina TaxID=2996016 RepID=UPI00226088FE|nr:asparaginase domain-containing protein [Marinicella marina]MCX7552859.1 asparaginase domain-containing protein [Marinicella marina]MDJ1139832.1 asparaginase domain-containing protein [Marinicella marina]
MNNLKIITTGGTIDKLYFDDLSDYQIGKPIIGELLNTYHVGFDFEVVPLLKKDSIYITDEDRSLIKSVIEKSDESHFLITHGTDTMVETAQYLQNIPGKTIVMTGALTPARFNATDAIFNIGCAVAAVQTQPNGVWVIMNGLVWDPAHVRKNRKANRFEEV